MKILKDKTKGYHLAINNTEIIKLGITYLEYLNLMIQFKANIYIDKIYFESFNDIFEAKKYLENITNKEIIIIKYGRGQKLEKEVNGNKIQYEIRGMCINIRDEQIAKNINEEQIEVLYNVYQDDIWVVTANEKELEILFKGGINLC